MRAPVALLLLSLSFAAGASEWSGNISAEYRYFTEPALYPQQKSQYLAVAVQPEWFHEWEGGKQSLNFIAFVRQDPVDSARSHTDIRELNWLGVFSESELRIGIGKVFWGVTESQHLVDVINQTDLVESIDTEEKLGQPMINYSLIKDWGTLDFFILPYFRERTFPGSSGRLRTQYRVDTDNPWYESPYKQNNTDYALRWFKTIAEWDIGLSYFNGTSRDPFYKVGVDSEGKVVFIPEYYQMQQLGLDMQMTREGWLWKLEAINRRVNNSQYMASTMGFEYTLYGVFDSSSDIGIVAEYLYDSRGSNAITPFEDDVMLGLRWTRNDEDDTQLLIGMIADRSRSSRLLSIEASRRVGNNIKVNFEVRLFNNIDSNDIYLYSFRKDNFIQFDLQYYF